MEVDDPEELPNPSLDESVVEDVEQASDPKTVEIEFSSTVITQNGVKQNADSLVPPILPEEITGSGGKSFPLLLSSAENQTDPPHEVLLSFLKANGQDSEALGIVGPSTDQVSEARTNEVFTRGVLLDKAEPSWKDLARRRLLIDGSTHQNEFDSRYCFKQILTKQYLDIVREKGVSFNLHSQRSVVH